MREPEKFYPDNVRLDNLSEAMVKGTKQPLVGVTQGGSSRPHHPAKQAATNPDLYRRQPRSF